MTEIESFKKTIEELARNFKAGSFDLKRLSEWVKLTSDDLLKTVNQREKAIKERDKARAEVENLRICLDGLKNCLDGATKDREYWIERAKQKDETISVIRAEMERLRGDLEKVSKQRDEAHAEVEKLKEEAHRQFKNAEYLRELSEHYQNLYLKEEERNKSVPPPDMSWSQTMAPATRPEPSRLEIAAMIYAAWSSNSIVTRFLLDGSGPDIWTEKEALRDADALIAASKEEVQK
jgi:chromosome segregation ATPase